MFSFKRPKVVNQLTTLINKNPEVTIKEVLANQDLSPSIRNEVPELLDFFCPPLPTPQSAERQASSAKEYELREERQKDLALLAFTSKLNREGQTFEDDKCFRFNRNASNILSSPSRKFHDRLVYYYSDGKGNYTPSPFLHQLIKFAKSFNGKVSVHHQPVFYGHFHRIFEAIVRSTKGEFFETIYKVEPNLNPFYKILVDRIYFTSIRQLYITCASEYPQQFAGSDKEKSCVYNELSKYGAEESKKIKGKKGKVLKKIYMQENEYNEYKRKADKDKTYRLLQYDQVGFVKNVEYLKEDEAQKKSEKIKEKVGDQVGGSGNIKRKKSRMDFYQNVVASLLAIRDILNDSIEVPQHLRNDEMITNILTIGKNLPESSFAVSLAYSLVLKIATSDNKSLNDYREILDHNDFKPKYENLSKLRARIEKPIHEDNQNECSGEHLIYQMPLYFLSLPKGFQDLFFSETKYSDQYDNQFVFSIKSVLTKDEQIQFFERDNNYFLKCLCKALPDPPKLNLADYKSNDDSIDPELGSIELDDNNNVQRPNRELLRGHLWDIAKYIDDEKRFKKDKLKFKLEGEWEQLHNKVVEYYNRVYAYTKEPVEEEEEEDNPDPSE